jgi:IS5 family transposase
MRTPGMKAARKSWQPRGVRAVWLKKESAGSKARPPPPLPLRHKYKNRLISKIRCRVEHPFACFKVVFKVVKTAYRGLENVAAQMTTVALAYNLRRFGYLARA